MDMKKVWLVIMAIILLFSLSACGVFSHISEVFRILGSNIELYNKNGEVATLSDGKCEYKGNTYYFRDGWDKYYKFYDDNSYSHQGELIGHFSVLHGYGDIHTACESDFGDSILKLSWSFSNAEFIFKDGFTLPSYKEVKIDKIAFKPSYDYSYKFAVVIKDFDKEENVYLPDIIDFDTKLVFDVSEKTPLGDPLRSIIFTLADYETMYIGSFELFESNNDLWLSAKTEQIFYKVKPEYQDLLKTILLENQE